MKYTTGQKLADRITSFMGSWTFILSQTVIIFIWISVNVEGWMSFDPFPFVFLNLFMSLSAAYAAPFILISSNRQAEIDRQTLTRGLDEEFKIEEAISQIHVRFDHLLSLIEGKSQNC